MSEGQMLFILEQVIPSVNLNIWVLDSTYMGWLLKKKSGVEVLTPDPGKQVIL